MISKSFAIALFAGVSLASFPVAAAVQSPIAAFDTDNDHTIDLAEATKAASAAFDRLEKDNDATLDVKELRSRIGKKEFVAADPDNDATLTKDEYLALVKKLFEKADADGEGTLDVKELRSKSGRALYQLLR